MDKNELKKQYAQTIQPMGIFQLKNLSNGKIFIDSGLNVRGKINSLKFQLSSGSFNNKELQEDFKKLGVDNFSFEILDYLKPREEQKLDYASDLQTLKEMWIEKLQPFGENGYNWKSTYI